MTSARARVSRGGEGRGLLGRLRQHRLEVALALPLFAYVLVLTVAPILDTVRLSLTAPFGAGFPSLANYQALVASAVFRSAVLNTIAVALLSLGLQLGVGLGVALALHQAFPLRGLVRTVMLVPLGVPTIVAGAVMLLVFSRSGYLNALLFALADAVNLIPGVEWHFVPTNWMVAGGWRTLTTLAIADMWKVLPTVTLIFLAAALPFIAWILVGTFEGIPREVEEAAAVDGASRVGTLMRVVFPAAAPGIAVAALFVWLYSWNEFLYARLLSTSQYTLPLQVFQAVDRGTKQQMAAVASVLVVPILLVVAVLQRFLRPGAMAGAIKG